MSKQTEILQVIDANLNRAREGVRVVEEVFRFIKKKQGLNDQLKDFRHKLFHISKKLEPGLKKIKLSRNVKADLGRDSFTASEKDKKEIQELVLANWSRVQESLRVLEEFSKIIDDKASFRFKKMRFSAYSLEKEMLQSL